MGTVTGISPMMYDTRVTGLDDNVIEVHDETTTNVIELIKSTQVGSQLTPSGNAAFVTISIVYVPLSEREVETKDRSPGVV